MISDKLVETIEKEGRKKNFHVHSAYSEKDEHGDYVFVIKLKRTVTTHIEYKYANDKDIEDGVVKKVLSRLGTIRI